MFSVKTKYRICIAAIIIIGLFIWLIRSFKPAQVEEDDFEVSTHSTAPNLTKQNLNV